MESGLKLTSRSQAVLKLAEKQREALGHRQLDTTHVLLGLVLEEEGIAGSVLRGAGITAEAVRAAIRGERDVSSVPPAAASQRPKASAEAPLRKPLWRILLRV
jgi:ATP-dependent Clp protease ATP-binding subunit ClpA